MFSAIYYYTDIQQHDKTVKCCWWWHHLCVCPPIDHKWESWVWLRLSYNNLESVLVSKEIDE